MSMGYGYGESRWSNIDRRNQRTWRKTCPSATLSTTKPTWIDSGANLGLHSERPVINRPSHGMALFVINSYPDLRKQLS
jgi:hypothetical protein